MQSRLFSRLAVMGIAALVLGGCGPTWSNSEIALKNDQAAQQTNEQTASVPDSVPTAKKTPSQILVTASDITNRKYRVIGDIDVTVNKTTLFHADPTRELVNKELQEKAAEMGADAVILVRYGTVGVSFMSWGSLDGKGRAVAFVDK